MKKRWFIVVIVILLVSSLITGCGVSKSQYDAATADLKVTQTQLQESQSELTKTKIDLQTAKTQYMTADGQRQTVQNELEVTQKQLQAVQSELTKTKTDLQTAQAQVQSLQKDQDAATKKRVEALSYTELLVISMFEIWMSIGVNYGYTFANLADWKTAMTNKANSIGDAILLNYIKQLDTGGKNAYYSLWYYCVDKIRQDLK